MSGFIISREDRLIAMPQARTHGDLQVPAKQSHGYAIRYDEGSIDWSVYEWIDRAKEFRCYDLIKGVWWHDCGRLGRIRTTLVTAKRLDKLIGTAEITYHDPKLTDHQKDLLRAALSYAFSNLDDLNELLSSHYTEKEILALMQQLGLPTN